MYNKSTKFARGTVWWIDNRTDSMCSTSQKGVRPFLIISNDEYNIKFGKATVIPMSHQDKYETYEAAVFTYFENQKCYILVDQIRQVDFKYLKSYAFTLAPDVLKMVDAMFIRIYTHSNLELPKEPIKEKVVENIQNPVKIEKENNLELRLNNLEKVVEEQTNLILKLVNDIQHNAFSNPKKEKVSVTTKKSTKANSKKNSAKKSKSSMPYGYFSDINNNIDFWNDLIKHGKEYVCDKYKLATESQFSHRKSRVSKFLHEQGIELYTGD